MLGADWFGSFDAANNFFPADGFHLFNQLPGLAEPGIHPGGVEGELSNYRNFYFVPLAQDNFRQKPTSLVAKFDLAPQTIEAALCLASAIRWR